MNKDKEDKEINLEDINLKYLTKGGAVKMISWGKDYKNWELKRQLEYAEALASAMNEACDVIQQERDNLITEKDNLKDTLATTEEAVLNQRTNNINSITKANATQQELIKTIRVLENEKIALQKRVDELSLELHLAQKI